MSYELKAVVKHSGGAGGGHYIVYVWDEIEEVEPVKLDSEKEFPIEPRDKSLLEQWYEFNDNTVTPVPASKLESLFGDGKSSGNAYILMYQHKSLSEEERTLKESLKIPKYWEEDV